jgi:archaellum component FlaD/FlaE
MNKQELREHILISLLINKYKDEDVNAQLVRNIEDEFNSINKELHPPGKLHDLSKLAKQAH